MKKIFFAGNYFDIGGPWEVNKNLVICFSKDISKLTFKNKALRFVEIIFKVLFSRIVIFSGLSKIDHISVNLCKILNKKIIYIMHGCLEIEYKINNNQTNNKGLKNEKILLDKSDRILCVSESYSRLISDFYPQYKNKIGYLTNGINWSNLSMLSVNNKLETRDENLIILMGGGRITKRNLQVCQAVDLLNKKNNTHLKIDLYGHKKDFDDSELISKIPCVRFMDVLPHEQILKKLQQAYLFVQNSDIESFSLGVIEALCCGCNILITPNVGAKDVISNIGERDIIMNNMDLQEIQEKILGILRKPNNEYLLRSINQEDTSIQASAKKLELIAKSFL